jgi:uncharacterized damage-inducible protein DinB
LLLSATAAFAQVPAAAPPTPPLKLSLAAGLQRSYAGLKLNLTQEAEKMPDDQFGFKPTPEVRAFGQLFGHVANSQYNACAAVKGVPNPNQGNDNEKKTTKAEFVKALAGAFAFCDDAFAALTDESALQLIKQGQNEVARGAALAGLIAHGNEMYGTGVVYLRLKGIVPPSTERAQQMRRPGQ